MTEQLENYLAIEAILELEPAADPFSGVRTDQVQSLKDVEAVADGLRERWSLGVDPIPSMTSLMESQGIKVIEADLPQDFDGLACTVKLVRDQPDTQAVVVSKRSNVERRRFTLAHELAHRVILGVADPSITRERAMKRFAAAFLVPAGHLRGQVGGNRRGFTYREIVRLKHVYGIAASSMLLRLRDIGVLSQAALQHSIPHLCTGMAQGRAGSDRSRHGPRRLGKAAPVRGLGVAWARRAVVRAGPGRRAASAPPQ